MKKNFFEVTLTTDISTIMKLVLWCIKNSKGWKTKKARRSLLIGDWYVANASEEDLIDDLETHCYINITKKVTFIFHNKNDAIMFKLFYNT